MAISYQVIIVHKPPSAYLTGITISLKLLRITFIHQANLLKICQKCGRGFMNNYNFSVHKIWKGVHGKRQSSKKIIRQSY